MLTQRGEIFVNLDEDRQQTVLVIRALQAELRAVPYMGADEDWNENSSDTETEQYLRRLKSLKREKDADSDLWRKITRWD